MKKMELYIFLGFIILFFSLNIYGLNTNSNSKLIPNNFPTLQEDTAILNSYARQALRYTINQSNVAIVKSIIDSASKYATTKKIEITPILHLARAEFSFYLKDFKSTAEEAQKALNESKVERDYKVMALSQNFLGNYCNFNGFFQEAKDFHECAIGTATEHNLKGILPLSYEGLANLKIALNNYDEAIQLLNLMLKTSITEDNVSLQQRAYLRLGELKMNNLKDYKQAEIDFKHSYQLAFKLNDTTKFILALNRIAWNDYLQNKLDTSLKLFNELITLNSKINDPIGLSNSYGNIGSIYRDKKQYDKALNYYEKALELAKTTNKWYNIYWIYSDLSDMYKTIKDYEKAYNYYTLYKQYNDSLIMRNFRQGLADARIRYDADSKEKELQLLSLKLNNQKLLVYGFAGFLVLSILIALLLIRQSKISAKRRISEMNRKISEITQANLRQQMNPHFIFNTLNSIQYYMYQHDKLATNNYLTKFSSLMRKILENSQHTSIPLNDELDAVKLYLELELIRFKDRFEYEIKVDDEIDTFLYKVPTMLIQPYVENAICHGLMNKEDKGLLKINVNLKTDHLACIIEDNGIGREAAMEIRKRKETNHNSLGTRITESRLDLVNLLYGTSLKTEYKDLKDNLGNPIGTRVEIQIPIIT